MMKYKLGKTPARPNAGLLRFASVFNAPNLPKPPAAFGHYGLGVGLDWPMFANDKYADCVWAGAAHEHMMWTHHAGIGEPAKFDDKRVLGDYAAVTGFDPANPATDQGTDMVEAASYRRKIGLLDSVGNRHKIDGYLAIRPNDWDQLMLATYLLGAVGIGITIPDFAERQFDANKPWVVEGGWKPEGGHYVCCVGRNTDGDALIVTWGRLQAMTRLFYETFNDESLAYVSLDALDKRGFSAEGYNADKLRTFLNQL